MKRLPLSYHAICVLLSLNLVGVQIYIAQQAHGETECVPPAGSRMSYKHTAHAQTICKLWGVESTGALTLENEGAYWSVDMWTDPLVPSGGTLTEVPEVPYGSGQFVKSNECFLGSRSESFMSDTQPAYIGLLFCDLYLYSGTLTATVDDEPTSLHVVGAVSVYSAEYFNYEVDHTDVRMMTVARVFESQADADEFVDTIAEGVNYDPDDPINCQSTWIGNDGYQCCMLAKFLSKAQLACASEYATAIMECLWVALGAAAAAAGVCLGAVAIAAAGIIGVKICLMLVGFVGIAAFAMCVAGAALSYDACLLRAENDYLINLHKTGCDVTQPD
jgi:hypothetical protein